MAKRLQVQGPNVRGQQINADVPIVDTYYRPQKGENKYAELSNFLSKVVPEVTSLMVKKDEERIKKDIDLIGEMAYSQKDFDVYEEFIKEKGIRDSHATYTAFNARRGHEFGKQAKIALDQLYTDNWARWSSQPDTSVMLSEVEKHLQDNFPQGMEDQTGFLSSYTKVVHNHNNHLSQNFTAQHQTKLRKDNENGLIEQMAEIISFDGNPDEATKLSNFWINTGIVEGGAYGAEIVRKGVILAIENDVANGGNGAEAIITKWKSLKTSQGAFLHKTKDADNQVMKAYTDALASKEREESRQRTEENRLEQEQKDIVANLVYEGQEVNPEDYPNLDAMTFAQAVNLGKNTQNQELVIRETSPDAYNEAYAVMQQATGSSESGVLNLGLIADELRENSQTQTGRRMITAIQTEMQLGLKDQPLLDYIGKIRNTYNAKLDPSGQPNTYIADDPRETEQMRQDIQRAENWWIAYKARMGLDRFQINDLKLKPNEIEKNDADAFSEAEQTGQLSAPKPLSLEKGDSPLEEDGDEKEVEGFTVILETGEPKTPKVEEPEVAEEPEVVEEPEVEKPKLTREQKAEIREEREEAILSGISNWWNSAVEQDRLKTYVKKQVALIKDQGERKEVRQLLSKMTIEQQVAYFAASEISANES